MDAQYVSLVEKAIQHDEDAFWKIYEMKWRDVLYTTLRSLDDENEAADAAQEAFLQAYRNIGSLKHPEAFNAWLYRIVVNVCNRMLSKRKIERDNKTASDAPLEFLGDERSERSPHESLDKKVDDDLLLEAIKALPGNQRTSVVLHYYNQMSYEEIAHAMGISKAGVETRLRRARKAIKKYMTEKDAQAMAPALLAAPVLAQVLSSDAYHVITPQMGEALKVAIEGGIALVAAGGAGLAASASGGAAAGGASTAATTATVGVGTKVAIGVTAAILTAGVGAGVVYQANKSDPQPSDTQVIEAPEPLPENTSSSETSPAVAAEVPAEETEAEPVAPETPIIPVQPADQSGSASQQPPSIYTLADMIGADNAQRLAALSQSANKSAVRSFLTSLGMSARCEQTATNETYRLYVLEKQDKRLYVIEKDGADYGISYTFGNRTDPLPESWELFLKY